MDEKIELNKKTVIKILDTLIPYQKGCENTVTNRKANFVQRQGAKKLSGQLINLIQEIESQL